MRNIKNSCTVLFFFAFIVTNGISAESQKNYKVLIGMEPEQALSVLTNQLRKTETNAEFLMTVQKNGLRMSPN